MSVPPIPAKGTADNLATIQEGATLGSYENHSLPDTTYVNNDIKPPSSAAPVNNYQNVNLDPLASPRMAMEKEHAQGRIQGGSLGSRDTPPPPEIYQRSQKSDVLV